MTYLHGAYGKIQTAGTRVAEKSNAAVVYIGTAPVHTIEGGAKNVNKPVLVGSIAEARALFGYSDDWAKYTLCEAMRAHLEEAGVGPLVLINVLDPAKHKKSAAGSRTQKPENGRVVLNDAEGIVLDTVKVAAGSAQKKKDVDYTIQYDLRRKAIVIAEKNAGALGTENLTISFDEIDAAAVKDKDVIGESDGLGKNSGVYAIENVYQETGCVPSTMLAPGFSSSPEVHKAMLANSRKVNGHWDLYLMVDLPLTDNGGDKLTLDTAKTWKNANGYTAENETVYFPMAKAVGGEIYHLSVLAAANYQALLAAQDGIPYKTPSNTACPLIRNLYMGADAEDRVFPDLLINDKLNQNGIASAAYSGGRWVIWGSHSADYSVEDADALNANETARRMLYYISNDFQHRRVQNVDKALTVNDIKTIIAEEQTRLDALVKIGALTYGEIRINADEISRSDMMRGDYAFTFSVTTTPLAKSLTAVVNWTDDGFTTYFADFE